jgi:hypothetical protein
MDYAALAARMDAEVDTRLGDSISYSQRGAPFRPIKGFVTDADPGQDLSAAGIDPLPRRKRVKVAIASVAEISTQDRLQADLLGPGIFRPRVSKPRVDGRYWLFDVERAG